MEPFYVGIAGFLVMLVLLLLGVYIAVAMGLVGLIGMAILIGEPSLGLLRVTPYGQTGSYEFVVLPLFILMGMFAALSGIGNSLFEAGQKWLGWMRGGLLVATTFSIGVFGACCGSSVAAATTFTRIALPTLLKHKYDPGLACAAIAAGGTQAALIPPSALLVFYGIITEQSIGELLLAGIIPGFLSMFIYMVTVWVTLAFFPEKGPRTMQFPWTERFNSLRGVWPIPVIFVCILGGLYLGIFTPSESGAIGAFLTLIVAGINMRGWKNVNTMSALREAVTVSSWIFLILICALVFVRFVALTEIPFDVANSIESLQFSPMIILIIILLIYIALGCFLDAVGMVALTIPFVYPIIEGLGIDGIWFGILLVKVVEIGLITPPVGINLFVVKGAAGSQVQTIQIFKGVAAFLVADILTLIILIAFPQLSLLIPYSMH